MRNKFFIPLKHCLKNYVKTSIEEARRCNFGDEKAMGLLTGVSSTAVLIDHKFEHTKNKHISPSVRAFDSITFALPLGIAAGVTAATLMVFVEVGLAAVALGGTSIAYNVYKNKEDDDFVPDTHISQNRCR